MEKENLLYQSFENHDIAGVDQDQFIHEPEDNTILGIPFNFIDCSSTFEFIEKWRKDHLRKYITFSNPHTVMLCRRQPEMRKATLNAGLVLPDGVGIGIAARLLKLKYSGRVSGPTFMLKICEYGLADGYRHFLYGGKPSVNQRLEKNLKEKYPGLNVAGSYSPPFRELTSEEDHEVIEMINKTKPDIVWVGLGAPKQEKWILRHLNRINAPVMIGVGAAFDFHSGEIPWAPCWIRRIGMEWAFRFMNDPIRMFRRNIDNLIYIILVCKQKLKT